VNRNDILDSLDHRVSSRSILQHPFYLAWERGELTRDQLAAYARIYYPHVKAFPDYLRASIGRADESTTRDELERNLNDELSEPKSHAELWLDFAEAMGLDRQSVTTATPSPAARGIVETFERLTRQDLATGLAALYAYESQQPEVSEQKIKGLRERYDVTDPNGLAYFDVHATADIHHRQGERDAIGRCLDSGTDPQVIARAADEALDAYWGLLDDVCTEAGVVADTDTAAPVTG
jgi:pyrroloquinoline-quinone synthase